MGLKIYNTLTRKKEEFIAIEQGKVKMYVCGLTPYSDCHMGHTRCYITFDIIRRYLEYKGKVEPRFMGDVYIEVEGIKVPNQVIFANETDAIVLGLVTFESCGVTVNPVNRKLIPLPRIHHY